jgi:hypothetical protein
MIQAYINHIKHNNRIKHPKQYYHSLMIQTIRLTLIEKKRIKFINKDKTAK